MTPDGVRRILSAAQAEPTDIESTVTTTKSGTAYLRLDDSSGRWAIVESPGDEWFALDVDGGFSLNHFEYETSDDETEQILRTYIDLAVAYMSHEERRTATRWLRRPRIVISTGGTEYAHRPQAVT